MQISTWAVSGLRRISAPISVTLLLTLSTCFCQLAYGQAPEVSPPYQNIPKYAISQGNALIFANNAKAVFYNYESGIVGAPFLDGVYKPFGLSFDSRYFLYLKAENGHPTFSLFVHDLTNASERKVRDVSVHHAAWSPTGHMIAYEWLDFANRFHLSVYNLRTGTNTDIAVGNIRSDFIDWSGDSSELLYLTIEPLNKRAFEDHLYLSSLHRYNLANGTEEVTRDVDWAQFHNGEVVISGKADTSQFTKVPNPKAEPIQRFFMRGDRIYVNVLERDKETVKLWNPKSQSYDFVTTGRLLGSTDHGVVIREFLRSEVDYKYVPSDGVPAVDLPKTFSKAPVSTSSTLSIAAAGPITEAIAGTNWKLPYYGQAAMVQGGQGYSDGSCDGVVCFITAHFAELAYALDFQQVIESNQGNQHILAVESGTVAATRTNIFCSANPNCSASWDNYSSTCNDPDGAGNYVAVAHLDGSYSFYAHLKSGSIQVAPGQTVSQGTYLADQGHSGGAASYNNYHVCGDHLHFQRQGGPDVWHQSIPTDFSEAPCLMACTSVYTSANVELAPAPTLTSLQPSSGPRGASTQVTINGNNFLYNTTVAVSGSGVTVSSVQLVSSTQLTATFTITSGAATGARNVTATTVQGTSNSLPFTVTSPVQITLSAPTGRTLTADGANCAAPCVFQWSAGSSHTIGTIATQSGGTGVQYVWSGWSDGGAISHSITVPSSATTYTANFITQYQLTTAANPSAGGSISPASGWVNAGTVVSISATANAGYTFTGFTGSLTGTTTPQNLTVNAASNVTANFTLAGGGSTPWYTTGGTWSRRKPITIDHTKVSGSTSLTNFPVLISLSDPNLRSTANGGSVGNANGTDILFTSFNGTTKLNHELESYDPVTGTVVAWVLIPSLSPTADTGLYIYYGNPGAADQQNRTGVWDTNYRGVWHLTAPTGTAVADSTSNANNGTKLSATSPSAITGFIGGAQNFNGSTDVITVPDNNSLDLTTAVTISAWIKAGGWPNAYGNAILNKEGNYALRSADVPSSQFDLLWWNGSGMTRIARTTPPSTGAWHYVVGQGNANDAYRLYVDGVLVSSAPANWYSDTRTLTFPLTIGGSFDPSFLGVIDEVRLSSTARSADWILTEYRNQSSPSTFYLTGVEENSSGATQVATPTFSPVAGTYTSAQSVTISTTTSGASIYYTTDGSTPTTASTLYTSPVNVGSSMTLKAFAVKSGSTDSAVTTAAYTINIPQVATPTFTPVAGTYTSAQSVTISTTTSGASIYYTTDGSTPTTASTLYTAPVNVGSSLTLKAFAVKSGSTDSAVATAAYTITPLVSITVTSSPVGRSITVDGAACTAPCSFQWGAGTSHTIATTGTQSGGTGVQYVWSSWSDGGAISHSITVPSSATTYTANFITQYQLTTAANPSAGGSISPASGWVNAGTVVSVSATANAGYTFTGFTGSLTGTTTPQNLTVNAASNVTANFTLAGGGSTPWYTTGGTWSRRKPITIDHTKVSGSTSLTNFPVLISLSDPNLRTTANGGSVGNANGSDILFTSSNGTTKLNHEIESYDPVAGALVAWVLIPSLSPTTDTGIYIYYGNPGAADQQNRTGVWDTNYRGVWHLTAPTGTAVADSTSNANNGTKVSATSPSAITGFIGGAQNFNGSTDVITVPDNNSLDLTTAVTISAWIKAGGWPNAYGNAILNKEGNYALRSADIPSSQFDLLWWNGSGMIRVARTTPPSTGVWHYVVGQANANDAYRLYVDGVLVSSAPANWYSDTRTLTFPLTIGGSFDPSFLGVIDEVRLSSTARSTDWIVTEYRNQSSPSTFYSVGAQE